MRTEKQRETSRKNGAKSKGPKSPEGKAITRFNGITHGLCARQVVIPGEDPAQFEAERKGWSDDWKPDCHTRAVLVERAAAASWRLRRCVRVEAASLRERADVAARRFDDERLARVEGGIARFEFDPKGALMMLELDATGIDRLIASWTELGDALDLGPTGWNHPRYHARLMTLLGHYTDDDPAGAGPLPRASARLLVANVPESKAHPHPLPVGDRGEAVAGLRALVATSVDRLRALHGERPDPAESRRQAIDASLNDVAEEASLRHRYEMAIERSLHATIRRLESLRDSVGEPAEAPEIADPPDRNGVDEAGAVPMEVVTKNDFMSS